MIQIEFGDGVDGCFIKCTADCLKIKYLIYRKGNFISDNEFIRKPV